MVDADEGPKELAEIFREINDKIDNVFTADSSRTNGFSFSVGIIGEQKELAKIPVDDGLYLLLEAAKEICSKYHLYFENLEYDGS
jgi:hypothetical protein